MLLYHQKISDKMIYDCILFSMEIFHISYTKVDANHNYSQTALHRHPNFYELHYIIDGECEFEIYNKERFKVKKDNFIIFPPNCQHKIISESENFSKLSSLISLKAKETNENTYYQEVIVSLNDIKVFNKTKNMRFYISKFIEMAEKNEPDFHNTLFFNYLSFMSEIFKTVVGKKEVKTKKIYNDKRVNDAIKFIEDNISAELTVSMVSDYIHISEKHLTRLFLKFLSISPGNHIKNVRATKLRRLLLNADYTLSDIAEALKYNDVSAMVKFFKNVEGITPQKFRDKIR